jgi:hypothetical protein
MAQGMKTAAISDGWLGVGGVVALGRVRVSPKVPLPWPHGEKNCVLQSGQL